MKKKEKVEKVSDDLEAFEEWEDAASEGTPEEIEDIIDEPIDEPVEEILPPISKKEPKGVAKEVPKASQKVSAPPQPPTPPAPQKSAKDIVATTNEVLQMTSDIPIHLVAVIGRTTVSVKDLMNYQMGQVVDLGRPPGETVDLVASGKLFARGELVEIDGKLGVRIVKLIR